MERRLKFAADPALAKEPTSSVLGAAEGAQKNAPTDAVVRTTCSEELFRRATTHPLPSLTCTRLSAISTW
jgi:hypothetical protein